MLGDPHSAAHAYALFEDCGEYGVRRIDPATPLAAVIAKWEAYSRKGIDVTR